MIEDIERNKKIDEVTREAFTLDDYCSNIFLEIIIREKIRFNQLHKNLLALGVKLSKPTLSEHLKHLLARDLITRKVEEAQNVT
ncbi:hypothetical protein KEJ21_05460, partial [Candidatus Bathyarchaeota archaeon]|nr:hypothetical protein [Candidatus Bathyarchaeota archaeon]